MKKCCQYILILDNIDPAVYKYNSTLECRRDLVIRQITLRKVNINTLNLEIFKKLRKKSEIPITPEQLHNTRKTP